MDYELKNIYFQLPMNTLPFAINAAISSFQVLLSGSQLTTYYLLKITSYELRLTS